MKKFSTFNHTKKRNFSSKFLIPLKSSSFWLLTSLTAIPSILFSATTNVEPLTSQFDDVSYLQTKLDEFSTNTPSISINPTSLVDGTLDVSINNQNTQFYPNLESTLLSTWRQKTTNLDKAKIKKLGDYSSPLIFNNSTTLLFRRDNVNLRYFTTFNLKVLQSDNTTYLSTNVDFNFDLKHDVYYYDESTNQFIGTSSRATVPQQATVVITKNASGDLYTLEQRVPFENKGITKYVIFDPLNTVYNYDQSNLRGSFFTTVVNTSLRKLSNYDLKELYKVWVKQNIEDSVNSEFIKQALYNEQYGKFIYSFLGENDDSQIIPKLTTIIKNKLKYITYNHENDFQISITRNSTSSHIDLNTNKLIHSYQLIIKYNNKEFLNQEIFTGVYNDYDDYSAIDSLFIFDGDFKIHDKFIKKTSYSAIYNNFKDLGDKYFQYEVNKIEEDTSSEQFLDNKKKGINVHHYKPITIHNAYYFENFGLTNAKFSLSNLNATNTSFNEFLTTNSSQLELLKRQLNKLLRGQNSEDKNQLTIVENDNTTHIIPIQFKILTDNSTFNLTSLEDSIGPQTVILKTNSEFKGTPNSFHNTFDGITFDNLTPIDIYGFSGAVKPVIQLFDVSKVDETQWYEFFLSFYNVTYSGFRLDKNLKAQLDQFIQETINHIQNYKELDELLKSLATKKEKDKKNEHTVFEIKVKPDPFPYLTNRGAITQSLNAPQLEESKKVLIRSKVIQLLLKEHPELLYKPFSYKLIDSYKRNYGNESPNNTSHISGTLNKQIFDDSNWSDVDQSGFITKPDTNINNNLYVVKKITQKLVWSDGSYVIEPRVEYQMFLATTKDVIKNLKTNNISLVDYLNNELQDLASSSLTKNLKRYLKQLEGLLGKLDLNGNGNSGQNTANISLNNGNLNSNSNSNSNNNPNILSSNNSILNPLQTNHNPNSIGQVNSISNTSPQTIINVRAQTRVSDDNVQKVISNISQASTNYIIDPQKQQRILDVWNDPDFQYLHFSSIEQAASIIAYQLNNVNPTNIYALPDELKSADLETKSFFKGLGVSTSSATVRDFSVSTTSGDVKNTTVNNQQSSTQWPRAFYLSQVIRILQQNQAILPKFRPSFDFDLSSVHLQATEYQNSNLKTLYVSIPTYPLNYLKTHYKQIINGVTLKDLDDVKDDLIYQGQYVSPSQIKSEFLKEDAQDNKEGAPSTYIIPPLEYYFSGFKRAILNQLNIPEDDIYLSGQDLYNLIYLLSKTNPAYDTNTLFDENNYSNITLDSKSFLTSKNIIKVSFKTKQGENYYNFQVQNLVNLDGTFNQDVFEATKKVQVIQQSNNHFNDRFSFSFYQNGNLTISPAQLLNLSIKNKALQHSQNYLLNDGLDGTIVITKQSDNNRYEVISRIKDLNQKDFDGEVHITGTQGTYQITSSTPPTYVWNNLDDWYISKVTQDGDVFTIHIQYSYKKHTYHLIKTIRINSTTNTATTDGGFVDSTNGDIQNIQPQAIDLGNIYNPSTDKHTTITKENWLDLIHYNSFQYVPYAPQTPPIDEYEEDNLKTVLKRLNIPDDFYIKRYIRDNTYVQDAATLNLYKSKYTKPSIETTGVNGEIKWYSYNDFPNVPILAGKSALNPRFTIVSNKRQQGGANFKYNTTAYYPLLDFSFIKPENLFYPLQIKEIKDNTFENLQQSFLFLSTPSTLNVPKPIVVNYQKDNPKTLLTLKILIPFAITKLNSEMNLNHVFNIPFYYQISLPKFNPQLSDINELKQGYVSTKNLVSQEVGVIANQEVPVHKTSDFTFEGNNINGDDNNVETLKEIPDNMYEQLNKTLTPKTIVTYHQDGNRLVSLISSTTPEQLVSVNTFHPSVLTTTYHINLDGSFATNNLQTIFPQNVDFNQIKTALKTQLKTSQYTTLIFNRDIYNQIKSNISLEPNNHNLLDTKLQTYQINGQRNSTKGVRFGDVYINVENVNTDLTPTQILVRQSDVNLRPEDQSLTTIEVVKNGFSFSVPVVKDQDLPKSYIQYVLDSKGSGDSYNLKNTLIHIQGLYNFDANLNYQDSTVHFSGLSSNLITTNVTSTSMIQRLQNSPTSGQNFGQDYFEKVNGFNIYKKEAGNFINWYTIAPVLEQSVDSNNQKQTTSQLKFVFLDSTTKPFVENTDTTLVTLPQSQSKGWQWLWSLLLFPITGISGALGFYFINKNNNTSTATVYGIEEKRKSKGIWNKMRNWKTKNKNKK